MSEKQLLRIHFATELVKIQCDIHFDRLKKELISFETKKVTDQAKTHGIDPNEILSLAQENMDQYEKDLELKYKLPYVRKVTPAV